MTHPILLVTGDFVKTGGMDRANYALADHLANKGRDVHLVAYRAADELLKHPHVTLHRVPKPLNSYTLGRPLLDRLGRAWARRIAGQGGRVVVNGGNCRWGDVNWVHHLNLLDTPKPGGGSWRRFKTHLDYKLYIEAERRSLALSRLIVTTCEKNRTDLHEHFGKPLDRIVTLYYGTDPKTFFPASEDERQELRSRFGWPRDRPIYAFVGALSDRRKGFDSLFQAWVGLCQRADWDANLVVVGSGSELEFWEGRAMQERLADRIQFLGFRRDVPDLFRACDAHILPSRYEGYSLVTQEALCCGLPAFVTRTAGIAERFPQALSEILLIPDPDDTEDLADRLLRWRQSGASHKLELAAFAQSLREDTWDDMAKRFAAVLSQDSP